LFWTVLANKKIEILIKEERGSQPEISDTGIRPPRCLQEAVFATHTGRLCTVHHIRLVLYPPRLVRLLGDFLELDNRIQRSGMLLRLPELPK
jgi:hypothetical protein